MSDDSARPDGPARLVYARDGSGMRLIEFVDEQGLATRYAYDDGRGIVTCREADGSTTVYAVPPGRMLARARHPETGIWVHVVLPMPSAAGSEMSAWPTRLPETTAEGATVARRVGGAPAPPRDQAASSGAITLTYDVAALARRPSEGVVTYTYDRDGRMVDDADET